MLKGREKSGTIVKNWSVKAKGCTDHAPCCLEPLPQRHGREMMNEKMGNKRLEILCLNRIESISALLVYAAELHREVCFFASEFLGHCPKQRPFLKLR